MSEVLPSDEVFTTKVSAGADAYAAKPDRYFAGARPDFVAELPNNPQAKILEIGCGSGGTGKLALEAKKCAEYFGVELCPAAAERASRILTQVIVGDVEKTDLLWPKQSFDALIMSEVLEHVCDPAAVLRKAHALLKPGAMVLASSPNVSHYSVIKMLLTGDWRVTDSGIMDRTHLRWFTPQTYSALFANNGYCVTEVAPVSPPGFKSRIGQRVTLGQFPWLFMRQIKIKAFRN